MFWFPLNKNKGKLHLLLRTYAFSQTLPIVQNLSLQCIELSFRFKNPLPLSIAIKLNEKMRKITKSILVISHISVGI
jgi:hypothetical protein